MSPETSAPSLLATLLLALLQGLTEFLPVSSSGHLAAAQLVWPSALAHSGVALEIAVHLGTTAAVLVYYRRLVAEIGRSAVAGEGAPGGIPGRTWMVAIVAGSIPTAAIGLAGREFFLGAFERLDLVAACLAVTGVVLMSTRWAAARDRELTLGVALAIGVAQGAAILPGISRSGTTVSLALLLGIDRRQAVSFSFLLSVPAILGAALLQSGELIAASSQAGALSVNLAFATLCAGGIGYVCIGLVHRATRDEWWHRFAWYCWLLAAVLAVLAS